MNGFRELAMANGAMIALTVVLVMLKLTEQLHSWVSVFVPLALWVLVMVGAVGLFFLRWKK